MAKNEAQNKNTFVAASEEQMQAEAQEERVAQRREKALQPRYAKLQTGIENKIINYHLGDCLVLAVIAVERAKQKKSEGKSYNNSVEDILTIELKNNVSTKYSNGIEAVLLTDEEKMHLINWLIETDVNYRAIAKTILEKIGH